MTLTDTQRLDRIIEAREFAVHSVPQPKGWTSFWSASSDYAANGFVGWGNTPREAMDDLFQQMDGSKEKGT